MIRAVLDTNQYVSMAIKAGGTADRLLAAWREGRFILLISPPILDEIIRVLRTPRLRRLIRLTAAELDGLIESLLSDAELTPGRLAVRVITRDPSDNMFLACAAEGRADYIVSGDQDLLTLGSYEEIPIVTAAEFIRILARQ
ncbi:MAG: putative toxin-antitoxin system toxin component, PIN family [Candidatus Rokubacteria bacterium]|nr:putative toxin-antitoxin system toxin component, PIN family [Candidatus Rokubacteria bacterium]